MKRILPFFLVLFGCTSFPDPIEEFNKLSAPILFVGKSADGAVTVCDSSNQYITIGSEYHLALVLSASYAPGDTIEYFRSR